MIRPSFHAKAAESFQIRAEALIERLAPITAPPPSSATDVYPTPFISAHWSEKDVIGPVRASRVDPFTLREIERVINIPGRGPMSLSGDSHKDFVRLAESIQRTQDLRFAVSTEFVMNTIAEWLEKNPSTRPTLPSFVAGTCEQAIHECDIWIPISSLILENHFEFNIGPVSFRSITSNNLKLWESDMIAMAPQHENPIRSDFLEKRRQFQGAAAGVVTIRGERDYVSERARELVGAAVGVLRLLHPALLTPEATCYGAPMGERSIGTAHWIVPPGFNSKTVSRGITRWEFNTDVWHQFKELKLDRLAQVFFRDNLSDFEISLRTAFSLYASAALRERIEDKLVYIFSALESILVRDGAENLQQTAAERIAYFSKSSGPDRAEFVRRYKSAYAIRSGFVHHGQSIDDITQLSTFFLDIWVFMMKLVTVIASFKTKKDFIDHLEEIKFS